jgi:hypothetical protein
MEHAEFNRSVQGGLTGASSHADPQQLPYGKL